MDNEKKKLIADYDEDSIYLYEGLEAIRKDTSMYVNSTGIDGIMQLLIEIIDNSVDESKKLLGIQPVNIDIELRKDGSAKVTDNGRGIPYKMSTRYHKPSCYIAFEHIHGGGKLKGTDSEGYSNSIGVHGVGLACVNALSKYLIINIKRDGKIFEIKYEKGVRTKDLTEIGTCPEMDTGTSIEFLYDDSIMSLTDNYRGEVDYPFDIDELKERLINYTLFNENAYITLSYELPDGSKGRFIPKDENYTIEGLLEKYAHENAPIEDFSYTDANNKFTVRTLFTLSNIEKVTKSAVNGLYVVDGGSHEVAFSREIVKVVREHMENRNILNPDYPLYDSEILDHISYLIILNVDKPEFQGQVKRYYSDAYVGSELARHYGVVLHTLEKGLLDSIISFVSYRYNERVARAIEEQKAKDKKLKNISTEQKQNLSKNLYDCTSTRKSVTEIWFVEGGSAGISLIDCRDKETTAVALLKGKLTNSSKSNKESLKQNEQFQLIQMAVQRNKYGKFIISADPDVDGKHIQMLFINLVINYFPQLIDKGMLYLAEIPLYMFTKGSDTVYAYSEQEKEDLADKYRGYKIQRFKGLGEFTSEQLCKILLEDSKFVRVTWASDAVKKAENLEAIDLLMGSNVALRKEMVMSRFVDKSVSDYFRTKSHIKKRQSILIDPLNCARYLVEDGDNNDEDEDYSAEVLKHMGYAIEDVESDDF